MSPSPPSPPVLRTERLLLRPPRRTDAAALAERRSDPEVAEYQTWIPPFPLERAETMIAELLDTPWLANDEWSMLTVADPDDSTVLGDLVMHPTWDGRSIEIGYTFARSAWGKGYAHEAVDALVDLLWQDARVTRLSAMLHPDNIASEQVLERTGFRFEGQTRHSFWVGDDNSDDLIYGMTRDDRLAWTTRRRDVPTDVRLVPVDAANVHDVRRLATHHSQERFVQPMAVSLADALRPPRHDGSVATVTPFGIEADGDLVGFALLAEPGPGAGTADGSPTLDLWRLLIDARHQRRGIGRLALDAVIDHGRRSGASALRLQWTEGRGSPRRFYEQVGFVPNGNVVDGETQAVLDIT